jgi:hypothetical protein
LAESAASPEEILLEEVFREYAAGHNDNTAIAGTSTIF